MRSVFQTEYKHPHGLPSVLPTDTTHFAGDIGDLSSNGDASGDPGEPPVKRERIEMNHSLQEI